jgi:diguanylate cyclase (GGDEF)-like protein
MGALVLYSAAGSRFGDQEQQLFAGIAEEIAPAIAVAEHHHAVKQASVVDLTTGAYAGWYLTQRFDAEIARAQRGGDPVTIVLVSVLDFEDVQRAVGYERADELLRSLAAEYAGLTRVFDIVSVRDRAEFAILLPDTDLSAAATVIGRVHQRSARVAERLLAESGGVSVQVVTGAASFPSDGDRVPNVMLVAEHRLNQNEVLQRRMAQTT